MSDSIDGLDLLRADLPSHLDVRLPRYVDGVVDTSDLGAEEVAERLLALIGPLAAG